MLFELTGGQGVDSPLLLREVSTVHNLIPRIYPNYHPTFHTNYTLHARDWSQGIIHLVYICET